MGRVARKLMGRNAESLIRDHRAELPESAPPIVIARGTDPSRDVRAAIGRLGGKMTVR